MKHISFIILIGLVLVGSQALAKSSDLMSGLQAEAAELNTPADASFQPVEILDIGCGPCQDWISDKGWHEGKNKKTNGSYFYVQSDSAVISAPPGHPNYVNSRQNAYVKALMKAKGKILKFLESEISREVTFDQNEGEFTWEQVKAQKNVQAAEESSLEAIKRKTLDLINATLDEKLLEKGFDPNSQNSADQEAVAEVVNEVINSSKFTDIVRSSSQQQLKGVRRIFVNESVKAGEQGEICMVALYSPKTMAMADAIFSDPSLAPAGTPNKPIEEQIPNRKTNEGVSELLSTFGIEMLRDENGQFHVIAFAQSAPKTNSKTSKNLAVQKARLRAEGQLRSFAQEYVVLNDALENSESAEELTDAMQNYESNEAFGNKLSSISGPIKINGVKQLDVWGAKHPLTGQIIIGSIVSWSPESAISAKEMKSQLNAPAKSPKRSSGKKSNNFKNDALKAKGNYQGSASGGSSEEDF
jgi:hypothetical protein